MGRLRSGIHTGRQQNNYVFSVFLKCFLLELDDINKKYCCYSKKAIKKLCCCSVKLLLYDNSVNSTKTLQWSPLQPIVDFTAAIGGVHCSVQWNPRQCLVKSTARSECLRYLIVESNALQRNSLHKNRQKSGIDCNVTAFVSGLRCTLSKTEFNHNQIAT